MERYQQAMVSIMTRRASSQQVQAPNSTSSQVSNSSTSSMGYTPDTKILTCTAGTRQDPRYLTISFASPSQELMTAKVSKRPKEQEASIFISASDNQLIIGLSVQYII